MKPSSEPTEIDDVDRRIVEALQADLPLVPRPYAAVAARLGLREAEFVDRTRRLVETGAVSRVVPTLDVEKTGGAVCLAAMEVPADRSATVAAVLERMPEVVGVDRRDHRLDLWFVIATEHPCGIGATQRAIETATGLEVLLFPEVRDYSARPRPEGEDPREADFDAVDRALIAAMRDGLSLERDPWVSIAVTAGVATAEATTRLRRMVERGWIRRLGAVANPRRGGPGFDVPTVWDVDDDAVDGLGARIAALPFVVGCRRRPRALPAWPYNLFVLVRGGGREAVAAERAEIADLLGAAAFASEVLPVRHVLKATAPCRVEADRAGDLARADRRVPEPAAE
ncbi:MAG: Lrp/AsnC family transcriptional regulator [Phyllobacteriaceae bacterium]|nr:Lrp/AsnC family transcriptional regulator [Phyllobacteriaceae bacterium]